MVLIAAAGLCSGQSGAGKRGSPPQPAGVSDTLLDGANIRNYHVTTRPNNRKVVYHAPSGSWFVFHGTGRWSDLLGLEGLAKEMIGWRQSGDGRNFSTLTPAYLGNGHSSSVDVLLAGDHVYLMVNRPKYWAWKAGYLGMDEPSLAKYPQLANLKGPAFYQPYEIYEFDITGNRLVKAGVEGKALPGDAHIGFVGPHYGSLTRDSKGYFWAAGRATVSLDGRYATWVSRSRRPDDISDWERHTVLFTGAGKGTHAPQIIGLDEARVACVLFVQHEAMTMVFLYDPASGAWGNPHILGKGTASKRASAVFEPGGHRMHVVYTDEAGDARHRIWAAPYGQENWSPALDKPGILAAPQAANQHPYEPGFDDDLSLSADPSRSPAPLALVHRGADLRLHLKYYDGKNWSPKDVKVGLQDPAMTCDEASTVADFSHGLGFAYLASWKDPAVRKQNDNRGAQVRFGLVKDVAALFSGK